MTIPYPGAIILEGSDVISEAVHLGGGTYRDELWTAIGGDDPRPILIVGGGYTGSYVLSNTHAVVNSYADLGLTPPTLPPDLTAYVALYFTSFTQIPYLPLLTGNEAAVAAYVAAGGTVVIADYNGDPAWDFLVGAGGVGKAHVAGVVNHVPPSPNFFVGGVGPFSLGAAGSDQETPTAAGLAAGFTQPPVEGYWEHQGYEMPFFGALGFNTSFMTAPDLVVLYGGTWSSLLMGTYSGYSAGDTCAYGEDEDDTPQEPLLWPECALIATRISVKANSPTVSPGRSFTSLERVVQPDAGSWEIELQDIPISSLADVLLWREIESGLNGRANNILVPVYEGKLSGTPIAATANANVAIGAVIVQVNKTAGAALQPGQQFSDLVGRMYRIKSVVSVAGNINTVKVWPPVRTPITSGDALEFNKPVCRCRLASDDGMNVMLELLTAARPSVRFLEDV